MNKVDVLALAVIEPQHQYGPAAKRPREIFALCRQVIHQRERVREEFGPDAGPRQVGGAHLKMRRLTCIPRALFPLLAPTRARSACASPWVCFPRRARLGARAAPGNDPTFAS